MNFRTPASEPPIEPTQQTNPTEEAEATRTPTALVTGTNRGTGRGIAEALRDSGWNVLSLNRTLTGESWLGEIECDLADPGDIDRALAEVGERVDRLDACVLNAAVRRLHPVASLPLPELRESVAVNLMAPFHIAQSALPLVRAAGGLYVFVGSHAGTRFFEGGAAYCMTKSTLRALVEVLLLEERRNGVRAVLVSPGAIANRPGDGSPLKMSARSVGRFVEQLITRTPADIAVGEVEIRPARLDPQGALGLDRLQHV
ncbi:SDR family oxidoreductase [Actinomadura terrae]|uniref:SDR family oxidoreductase n=1 Tax=Actinomadura terrae TaxID=604353 RepID=UPI001FA7772B|nr:SDR family NAD(P)-dependent oxidoreductase [Actinomadura terrae]